MHVTIASISRAKSHLSLSRTTEPERHPEDTTKALLTPTRISSSETFVLRAITLSAALSSSVPGVVPGALSAKGSPESASRVRRTRTQLWCCPCAQMAVKTQHSVQL